MIIPKEEVEKAALEYIKDIHAIYHIVGCDCFIEGAKFVENKVQQHVQDIIIENQGLKLYKDNETERFKKLAIEFYSWRQQYQDLSTAIRINEVENSQELFDKFIKERNETNS